MVNGEWSKVNGELRQLVVAAISNSKSQIPNPNFTFFPLFSELDVY
jgi:hypothetical protein